jgi:hypothetical protein
VSTRARRAAARRSRGWLVKHLPRQDTPGVDWRVNSFSTILKGGSVALAVLAGAHQAREQRQGPLSPVVSVRELRHLDVPVGLPSKPLHGAPRTVVAPCASVRRRHTLPRNHRQAALLASPLDRDELADAFRELVRHAYRIAATASG